MLLIKNIYIMLVTTAWMEENYNKYNKIFWNGKLPKIEFVISNSEKTWGRAEYNYNLTYNRVTPMRIIMSNYYNSPEQVKLTTLLHEMIHIADYTFNPTHFVCNHRKVRYNSHGYWFQQEAARLAKYGWEIEQYVTASERESSVLSANAAKNAANKINNTLVVEVICSNYSFMFKTSHDLIGEAFNTMKGVNWNYYYGNVKTINIYKTSDVNFGTKRSCGKSLKGWSGTKDEIKQKLNKINAEQIYSYNDLVKKFVA